MINNQAIASLFKLGASLLELYGENKFKIRSYENAASQINNLHEPIAEDPGRIEQIEGIGENIAKKIRQILETGTFEELERLLEKTPEGVLELIQIKGIGPKKIATAWQELGITTPDELLKAGKEGRLKSLKGFGEKTERNIKAALEFYQQNKHNLILPHAFDQYEWLREVLDNSGEVESIAMVGPLRRRVPVIPSLDFQLILKNTRAAFREFLSQSPYFAEGHVKVNGNTQWIVNESGIPVNFFVSDKTHWQRDLFFNTGASSFVKNYEALWEETIDHEADFFDLKGEPYWPPEMREDYWTDKKIDPQRLQHLITYSDLKGCLHNHSQFSDGVNTLREMAIECRNSGLDYFGIADHSKAAFYANGLDEKRLADQAEAVDKLNSELAPFTIFKGTEADIHSDGSLDFDKEILKTLDFVVASIHTPLKMDEEKATQRLIRAVDNPFTTILGHITGRLLLRRAGYPVDHKKVIEACAANEVVIEINANPRRLDIDWRWMDFALQKGVILSINPDAHNLEGIRDMEYGVMVARKAGVPKESILNAFSREGIAEFFRNRKEKAIEGTYNTV